jgi:hypothetical protein
MEQSWGTFEDMALYYLKELAKRGEITPVLARKCLEPVYTVCTLDTFNQMCDLYGQDRFCLVFACTPVEFILLFLARHVDFFPGEEDAVPEKNLQTGE